jgi:hypothetical protein
MTQESSILDVGRPAVDGPADSLVRLAATELLLMVALVVIGLLACSAMSRSASVPVVQESTRSQPAVGADIRPFPGHEANNPNNDGGLGKGA